MHCAVRSVNSMKYLFLSLHLHLRTIAQISDRRVAGIGVVETIEVSDIVHKGKKGNGTRNQTQTLQKLLAPKRMSLPLEDICVSPD